MQSMFVSLRMFIFRCWLSVNLFFLVSRSIQVVATMAIYSTGTRRRSKARWMTKSKKVSSLDLIFVVTKFALFSFHFLADLISTIEFSEDGELLAVGDKGGRIVIFQREQQVSLTKTDLVEHLITRSPRFSF